MKSVSLNNGDVRVLTESSEIAVFAHVQWKYGQKYWWMPNSG